MRFQLIIFYCLLLLLSGCNSYKEYGIYECGKIDFRITYLQNNTKNSVQLLPKQMRLIFNQNHAISTIYGLGGFFKLRNFTDYKNRDCKTLIEVGNSKYVYEAEAGELMCCFDEMKRMRITHTKETKVIAGLNCKKAIITFPKKDEIIEIYYTDEIKLRNPNIRTPYKKIKGVLMDFQLTLSDLKMQFTAYNFVEHKENLKLNTNTPKNATEVNRYGMIKIIERLME